MPRARQTEKESAEGSPPYTQFARQLNAWVLMWRAHHPDVKYNQRNATAEMGINYTSFSYILNGRYRPTIEQCLILARYFEIPLEDVLRAAGYFDLAGLRKWVAEDTALRDPAEKQYVLDVLRIALSLGEWQREIWQQSPFKDRAERALASSRDPYERAVEYADAVYEWGHSPERSTPRGLRNTDDIMPVVS